MNAKKFFSMAFVSTLAIGFSLNFKFPKVLKEKKQEDHFLSQQENLFKNQLTRGLIPIKLPNGASFNLNFAQAQSGDAQCETNLTAAREACDDLSYTHGALDFFNSVLCRLNNTNAANVENIFCHFRRSMDVEPDLANLPQTVTKSMNGIDVELIFEDAPTTGFAATNGYLVKATVTVNDNADPYMVIYWGFEDNTDLANADATKTKGYLIEGITEAGLGGPRASYLLWDLTGTQQTGRVMGVEFNSAESLMSDATNDDLSPSEYFLQNPSSDRVFYGKFSINTNTKVVSIQGTSLEPKRATPANQTACFKIFGTGTKGGQMLIAKSRDDLSDSFSEIGHGTADTNRDFSDMDAACLLDLKSTTNGIGNLKSNAGTALNSANTAAAWQENIETVLGLTAGTVVFDYSCQNLAQFAGTGGIAGGKPFSDDHGEKWVDFTAEPSDIFTVNVTAPTLPGTVCDNDGNSNGIDDVTGCACN